jgi:hypothetical protein
MEAIPADFQVMLDRYDAATLAIGGGMLPNRRSGGLASQVSQPLI